MLDTYRAAHQERELCIPLAEFKSLFAKSSDEFVCAYCHISETEFEQLRAKGLVYTKRLRTRGTSFELDCREPALGYAAGNVVMCCYWCNNAKSDEFSPEEFLPAAQALERAWRGRLGQNASPCLANISALYPNEDVSLWATTRLITSKPYLKSRLNCVRLSQTTSIRPYSVFFTRPPQRHLKPYS